MKLKLIPLIAALFFSSGSLYALDQWQRTTGGGTPSYGSLTLNSSATPTPTAEGKCEWDSDDNFLVCGDGAASKNIGDDATLDQYDIKARVSSGSGAAEAVDEGDLSEASAPNTSAIPAWESDGSLKKISVANLGNSKSAHSSKMYRNAAQSITTATATKVAFDTVEYDYEGIADATTNDRFDIVSDGVYLIQASYGAIGFLDDGESVSAQIRVNGTETCTDTAMSAAATSDGLVQVSCLLDLSASDYIEMYIEQDSGGSEDTETTAPYRPYMSVSLVNLGNLPAYNHYAAELVRTAAQSIPDDTFTKIAFDGENFDVGDIADYTTNDRVDIPEDGLWLVRGSVVFNGVIDDGEVVDASIYVNGSNACRDARKSPVASNYMNSLALCVLELSAGDYVELYVKQGSGSAQNTDTATTYTKPLLAVSKLNAASKNEALIISDQTLTTADLSASVGMRYRLDIDGMTADRSIVIPACNIDGTAIEFELTTDAPADYELVLEGDTGVDVCVRDTCATAAEVTRYFIQGESARLVCDTTLGDWVVNKQNDGRIQSFAMLNLGANVTTNGAAALLDLDLDTVATQLGGLADTTNGYAVPRRNGNYELSAHWSPQNGITDGERMDTYLLVDGTIVLQSATRAGSTSTLNAGMIPPRILPADAGDVIKMQVRNGTVNSGVSGTASKTWMSVVEQL